MNKQWLNEFKLALIQEDIDKLEELLDQLDLRKLVKELAQESHSDKLLKENASDVLSQIYALLEQCVVLISQKKQTKAEEIQKFQKALMYHKS